ncbi:His-Xaa-Ser system radical SAM maturase HxsB [Leptospira sp. 'Mane']|uniref:His-Xaa-Ser system radical SAM maturase HxsB n=1 Tax=Leptospira sp. 'Mane' TaxID=3387407 RepID=UPI00398A6748
MNVSLESTQSRRFKSSDYFHSQKPAYFLLPFKFHRLNATNEIIVNEVGDFTIVETGTYEKIIKRQINETDNKELYTFLVSNFFISEHRIDPLIDVLATRYRTKKSFLNGFTSLHIFVITLRCEHSCRYCQVSRVTENKKDFDMTEHYIRLSVDMMFSSPNEDITMEFQGGEALLAFDKIIYAINYVKEKLKTHKKNIRFVICTNLALMNEKIATFCKENQILISTSLDGPEFLHNANRKRPGNNSYEVATKGIEVCRSLLGHDSVSALMTTSKLSLNHPIEIVEEYFNRGFQNIFLRPISPYGFALKDEKQSYYETSEFLNFYKKAMERIIQYNLEGHIFREDYATILLKKILTPFSVGYVDLNSPSGAITNAIVFNYDGAVYASDEGRMLAESKEYEFKLGHLDTHTYNEIFYGEKVQKISHYMVNENLAGCSDCAYQAYCGADPIHNYATQGTLAGYRPTSSFCQKNMEIINYLFETMTSSKEIRKIFESWVS